FDSWTTIWPAVPAFDMRVGGLGVLILVALPFALIRVVRQRSVVLVLVFVATLATPDPAVERYVLAFAGLVMAFAVPTPYQPSVGKFVRAAPLRVGMYVRVSAFVLFPRVAAHIVYAAFSACTGGGQPLRAYVGMSDY